MSGAVTASSIGKERFMSMNYVKQSFMAALQTFHTVRMRHATFISTLGLLILLLCGWLSLLVILSTSSIFIKTDKSHSTITCNGWSPSLTSSTVIGCHMMLVNVPSVNRTVLRA